MPHPTAGTYNEGDLFEDRHGTLWLCTRGGTPGEWIVTERVEPNELPLETLENMPFDLKRLLIAHRLQEIAKDSHPITYHGNGFTQVFVRTNPKMRLHIWHPEMPSRRYPPTPIHNHRFSFESRVLVGAVENRVYDLEYLPEHMLRSALDKDHVYDVYEVQRGLNHVPRNVGVKRRVAKAKIKRRAIQTVPAGESYAFAHSAFHESVPHGLTVTLATKTEECAFAPRILCPEGTVPVCAFDSTYTEDQMWEAVDTALEALNGDQLQTLLLFTLKMSEDQEAQDGKRED